MVDMHEGASKGPAATIAAGAATHEHLRHAMTQQSELTSVASDS